MAILKKLKRGILAYTEAETQAVARALARVIPPDQVLVLHGNIGVGKTTFVRGLARAWGITQPIKSPTFTFFTFYRGTRMLVHFDAFRIEKEEQVEGLMIEEWLESPWCLAVEWPERLGDRLPDTTWHVYLEIVSARCHRIRMED